MIARLGRLLGRSRPGAIATFLRPGAQPDGVEYLGAILLNFSLLAAWSALYYGINYYLLLEEQIDQRERLESQASTAQLAMLRYQLNPHFLFNTLNSISTLVLLSRPSGPMRCWRGCRPSCATRWSTSRPRKVTVAQEVETLKLYLEIEKMRFEDRLRPHFQIESETIGARLPSLLLQPLIENAIKYAVTPQEEGADIWIERQPRGRARCGSTSPTPAPGDGRALSAGQPVDRRRPGEHSRPSGAGLWRRTSVSRHRTNERGGFSVIIEIPYRNRRPRNRNDHPDHPGRRRAAGDPGPAAAARGA